jgi:FMN phosphatase YigB (HAD superfamily)
MQMHIHDVLFDFGGVIAEEGFREGLRAIAIKNHRDEDVFMNVAQETIHASGYLIGKVPESTFWEMLRKETGIKGDDADFRDQCLSRFLVRDWMLALVRKLNDHDIRTGILSDQTDWLDRLNAEYDFFRYFRHVFNSYYMGNTKKNPDYFDAVVRILNVLPQDVLFIDDDSGNCERAKQKGLNAIHYIGREDFLNRMASYCPFLGENGTSTK